MKRDSVGITWGGSFISFLFIFHFLFISLLNEKELTWTKNIFFSFYLLGSSVQCPMSFCFFPPFPVLFGWLDLWLLWKARCLTTMVSFRQRRILGFVSWHQPFVLSLLTSKNNWSYYLKGWKTCSGVHPTVVKVNLRCLNREQHVFQFLCILVWLNGTFFKEIER